MERLQQSYVCGEREIPRTNDTIGRHFDVAVTRWPTEIAVVAVRQGIRWTYNELKRQVDSFAAGLLAIGLQPGDRIAIWLPNRAEWLVAQYAAAKAGLILVNLHTGYRAREVELSLNAAGCKALILASSVKRHRLADVLRELAPEIDRSQPGNLRAARLPALRTIIGVGSNVPPGFVEWSGVQALASAAHFRALDEYSSRLAFDAPACIQFTSGTTGSPKGVTLSHHGMLNNARFSAQLSGFDVGDRLCVPVPLYHAFGMGANLCAMARGCAVVYPGGTFDPAMTLRTVQDERCTALFGAPTMFSAELRHLQFADFDLTSLSTAIISGAPCPQELVRKLFCELTVKDVIIRYGMTENSPTAMMTRLNDSMERCMTTVGRVHPHIEAKVVDNQGRIVSVGIPGELCVRGYSVMLGYWNDPLRTAEVIDSAGWLHTGDLAQFDQDGFCRIVGRLKEVIIRGGENIYPLEVEEFLQQHPKVEQAHIVGIPDKRFGEELCAWIKLSAGCRATAHEIRSFCRTRIANFKIPKYIYFTDSFPVTGSGKIQKFLMREYMLKELHRQALVDTPT